MADLDLFGQNYCHRIWQLFKMQTACLSEVQFSFLNRIRRENGQGLDEPLET